MVAYTKRMRDLREDHDLTQKHIADKLGMKQQQYQAYESGAVQLPITKLQDLCVLYEVSADYLLGLTDDDPLLSKKRREILSDKSKDALRLFEDYLVSRDRMNAKK